VIDVSSASEKYIEMHEIPDCPKCKNPATKCKGGTGIKNNKKTKWICDKCLHEW
jgi:transposase-like protein